MPIEEDIRDINNNINDLAGIICDIRDEITSIKSNFPCILIGINGQDKKSIAYFSNKKLAKQYAESCLLKSNEYSKKSLLYGFEDYYLEPVFFRPENIPWNPEKIR